MNASLNKPVANEWLPIGKVAERTGLSVSAIRHYESEGLINAERNSGGQRRFRRYVIRRLSFIMIAQGLGFTLADIKQQLDTLPSNQAPTARDWQRMGKRFRTSIDERIAALEQLRDTLSGCIGCGCLSLTRCALYNPEDRARQFGAGPRYLQGDQFDVG